MPPGSEDPLAPRAEHLFEISAVITILTPAYAATVHLFAPLATATTVLEPITDVSPTDALLVGAAKTQGSATCAEIGQLGFNPFSAGIDFRRQNLTSVDVRF